jgi:hypothetical protein
MNRFDRVLRKYFIFALPLLGLGLILSFIYGADKLNQESGFLGYLNDIFGWTLMLWILVSLYLFIKMIFSNSFREHTLKKFIRVKDADERESIISGDAAKLSMISTFALMTFLLFLSMMTVSVGKIQGERLLKSDKRHFISIGFDPLLMNKKQKTVSQEDKQEIFTYSGLPLPTSIILLFIFCWQLISFHLIVRKNLTE